MGFEQFSRLLTTARQRAGLTKAELAERLGIISRQSITNWEGVRPPKRGITPEEVNALSKALDVSVLDLVTALGYAVKFEGIADEAEAALLVATKPISRGPVCLAPTTFAPATRCRLKRSNAVGSHSDRTTRAVC